MGVSVAVVDDHPLIRRGLAEAIREESDLNVAWTATSVAETMDKLQFEVPDVAVVDLVLTDGQGLDLVRDVKKKHINTKILVSSMQDETVYANRCLKAGAHGFIGKSEPVETLIDAVRLIVNDQIYLSPKMTSRMLQNIGSPNEADGVERLSDRELQVLEMIGTGKDTKSIAKEMHVSPKTIDSFRERIKSKLQISNATELMHFAVRRTM
ncbi:response regulator transcription factor [Planctomycetes bacterium K23_9]|uniref:Oxygen regulatory protein NreC n=1 Tax=Stieleria marina TaxID=1930275 RepID=A0A517NWV5_9BACT|nr:Oxygen regulatory protein NreC [Planctomycetes bacterium K23_9]